MYLNVSLWFSKCHGCSVSMLQTCDVGICVEEEGEESSWCWMLRATRVATWSQHGGGGREAHWCLNVARNMLATWLTMARIMAPKHFFYVVKVYFECSKTHFYVSNIFLDVAKRPIGTLPSDVRTLVQRKNYSTSYRWGLWDELSPVKWEYETWRPIMVQPQRCGINTGNCVVQTLIPTPLYSKFFIFIFSRFFENK
jgi:hypothetical protein